MLGCVRWVGWVCGGMVCRSGFAELVCLTLLMSFWSHNRNAASNPQRLSIMADNGHLVCWESGMRWTIVKASASSLWNTLVSGTGFMAEFTGPGVVYCQTRSMRVRWCGDGGRWLVLHMCWCCLIGGRVPLGCFNVGLSLCCGGESSERVLCCLWCGVVGKAE